MASIGDKPSIEDVQEFWDRQPCNIKHSNLEKLEVLFGSSKKDVIDYYQKTTLNKDFLQANYKSSTKIYRSCI